MINVRWMGWFSLVIWRLCSSIQLLVMRVDTDLSGSLVQHIHYSPSSAIGRVLGIAYIAYTNKHTHTITIIIFMLGNKFRRPSRNWICIACVHLYSLKCSCHLNSLTLAEWKHFDICTECNMYVRGMWVVEEQREGSLSWAYMFLPTHVFIDKSAFGFV